MPTLQDLVPLLESAPGSAYFDNLLAEMSDEDVRKLAEEVVALQADLRKTRQIQFYEPVNPRALAIHLATEKEVVVRGGNRSTKSDSLLADAVICMTKIIPESLKGVYPVEKIKCPMRVRLVCESLTNTWDTVLKPKLQWNRWNGSGIPGGTSGHWGWIPPSFLIHGKWEDSWREKDRVLTLRCGCTFQVMSNDQDLENFSGDSLHRVINDEPPREDIYQENKFRLMDTQGQMYSGFTPSNDPQKAMRGAWIYEIYDKGTEGPGRDPDVRSITLHTEDNRILDPAEIAKTVRDLTPQERATRLHGDFFHLTGRIYPNYTDRPAWWCFGCNQITIVAHHQESRRPVCSTCAGDNVVEYCNFVEPFEQAYTWPIIFCLDPHPRKPNMMMWVAVDPSDDLWQVGEMEVDGDPATVRDKVNTFERSCGFRISARLIDPNMAESAAHQAGRRHVSVRDEFDAVGIRCALANDSFTVGMKRVRELIRPDERTKSPRLHIFNTCHLTNKQLKNYVWAEWSRQSESTKDAKAMPITKNDDFPTMLRYVALSNPTHRGLTMGLKPMRATRRPRPGSEQRANL